MRLQRWGLAYDFGSKIRVALALSYPLKGMATLLKIVSTKAYIRIKLVHRCIMNHFHSLLMRACDYCWVGGGVTDTPYTIKLLVIILAVNGLNTVFYGVNLVKIHLFGLTFPLRTQTKPN